MASVGLSASADSMSSNEPLLTIATTARGFGSSGAGPVRPGLRRHHADAETAGVQLQAGARRRNRNAAGARRREHAPEVGLGGSVASVQQQVDRKPPEHLGEAAVVVRRRVRGNDRAEAVDSCLLEQPRDPRIGPATVEQDGAPVRVLDQRRVPLPDVEERHRQPIRRRRADRRPRN